MTKQQDVITPEAPEELREVRRIEAIHRWRVLEAPPDAFGSVTALAAKVVKVPYGTVCIIDGEHVWFKDPYGITIDKIPRRPGLCCSVVETGEPLFLPDVRTHPDSARHPLVTGEFGLRFYAGVPLRTADGYHIGTLAVFDQRTRPVSSEQRTMLIELAAVVVREVEVRVAARVEVAATREQTEKERSRSAHLCQALGSHGVIGQAMGILMAQRGCDSAEAFAMLRMVSQRENVKLVSVAGTLVRDFDSRMHKRPG